MEFLRLHQKPSHMWFITLHCITGQNFKRIWLLLVGCGQKNTQKQPKIWNFKDISKLGNYISGIKWNLHIWYKPRYALTPNTSCLPKNEVVNHGGGRGGRREGILKLLVKVSLKFERSFGDLLHINPQKMWPKWLRACLLIINSPLTSSYSFSLSFFEHWHSFTNNQSTKSLLLSQKPSKTGSVSSIFSNIEKKKNFQKLHVSNKRTTI